MLYFAECNRCMIYCMEHHLLVVDQVRRRTLLKDDRLYQQQLRICHRTIRCCVLFQRDR